MLHTIALLLSLISAPSHNACETVGPRLDGTMVTICGGSVRSVQDSAGNVSVAPFSTER